MNTYRYICRTATSGLPWQYDATFPSDNMALEYGSKIISSFAQCQWFMCFDVWQVEPERHVGTVMIRQTAPETIVTTTLPGQRI